MKRLIILIALSIALCLLLTACGNSSNTEPVSSESAAYEQQSSLEEKSESVDVEKQSLLGGTYKVPLKDIYIDIPNATKIEVGFSRIFLDSGYYVAFTFSLDEPSDDSTEVFEKIFYDFRGNIENYQHINNLGEYTKEDVEVNNIDACLIKGKVSAGRYPVYDAYIYGYSFTYNGVMCQIMGGVIDEAQTESEINEVTEIVDAMMKTVRSTK